MKARCDRSSSSYFGCSSRLRLAAVVTEVSNSLSPMAYRSRPEGLRLSVGFLENVEHLPQWQCEWRQRVRWVWGAFRSKEVLSDYDSPAKCRAGRPLVAAQESGKKNEIEKIEIAASAIGRLYPPLGAGAFFFNWIFCQTPSESWFYAPILKRVWSTHYRGSESLLKT